MFENRLNELKKMSVYAGERNDFVQGGGGNTSVKLDRKVMAVKASGYLLKDVNEREGFALVDYGAIRSYYGSGAGQKNVIAESCLAAEGAETPNPSMEAGFHALLGKYVIHTHSVYSNVITCSENGEEWTRELFEGDVLWGRYVMPGDDTADEIRRILMENKADADGKEPICIFLQNHGMIVSANTLVDAIDRHESVNAVLRERFGRAFFTDTVLQESGDCFFAEDSYFLKKHFENIFSEGMQDRTIFPDQTVYLGNAQRRIDCEDGKILFRAERNFAEAMFYTLAAYAYILETAGKNGLRIHYLPPAEVRRLLENEKEKYRKKAILGA